MILWPLRGYEPLDRAGAWRLVIMATPRFRFDAMVQHYPQGAVYHLWLPFVKFRLMIKT